MGLLIENCKYAQTSKMLEYYKSLKPYARDVKHLIRNCPYAQTSNMVEYYKLLEDHDFDWIFENQEGILLNIPYREF